VAVFKRNFLHESRFENKEYFTSFDMWRIPKSSRHIQDFLDMKYGIFGQAVSKIYDQLFWFV
jgi:hypothetical protein